MINSIWWAMALCSHIATIFTLRRVVNDIRSVLKTLDKDVRRMKVDTHNAVNESADNRLNILANQSESKTNCTKNETKRLGLEADCKARHTEAVEMYNGQLNYAKREWSKTFDDKFAEIHDHLKVHDSRIQDRDDAIAQRFADVHEAIKDCKRVDSWMQEALETLPKPRGRPRKKDR